ncbi:response regulator receiver domain protein [Synechococcus sp. PCC 7335]|uniref:response regulator n=1 Tax=Synechococcus sp. (strain ATCC 29403 / PCC 7335) TaxID=91464 RepID=UPI00017EC44E|nr:response regulator [Synechococcus sp. PCC 7335]EDX83045.1 response regulator receiver domain protein [Synechococcus sp. PCC 7335]
MRKQMPVEIVGKLMNGPADVRLPKDSMRILLVDDDAALMDILAEQLIKQRYVVDIATDGESAEECVNLFSYDFIILDMGLPDIEGISLCQRLRQQKITSPILMLTAEDNSKAKVKALNAGADDYVVKPFDFEELFARIRALRRRDNNTLAAVLQQGDLRVDPNTFEVFYQDRPLRVTPKEYTMLELFLRHPNQVFSIDAIIDNLWSFEDPPSEDAVRTHVKGLRQKLKAGGAPKDFIQTVYGLGYRLKAIKPGMAVTFSASQAASKSNRSSQPMLMQAIAAAWEKHQNTIQERLDVLEATAAAVKAGQLSAELQAAGRSQAHKLAGSMGCFGFAEGSRIARELEQLLKLESPLTQPQGLHFSALVSNLREQIKHSSSAQIAADATASAPQILAVGAPSALHAELEAAAIAAGLRCAIALDYKEAIATVKEQSLTGLLLWTEAESFDEAVTLLAAVAKQKSETSTTVITDIQDFGQRLQLVQQGADVLLKGSASAGHAVETVQQALKAAGKSLKVVAIDDDPQVLALLQTILSPWGFQTTALENADRLFDTLESVRPDLLLIDVEMPETNGLEICRVLRADERWQQLPILFLSVHDEDHTQHQAFNVGADDFISKTTMATELPTRLINRLKRTGRAVPALL